MRHAVLPSLQAFLRGLVLPVLMLSGTLASAQALTNGDFESPYVAPNIDGWLKTKFLNTGLTGATPYNGTSIVRVAGGNDLTNVVTAPPPPPLPESQVDADLGAAQSLRWPKFGAKCVLINPLSSSAFGNGRNGNSVKQTFTLDSSMIDPALAGGDDRLHIRFAFAPVLQNPVGHGANQQPYFYIGVKDVSKANVSLYDNLNFSNQPGSPWKSVVIGGQAVVYTDWQVKDIALDPAVYLNDIIEIEFLAAGCSPTGHWGKLYVDGCSAVIPGLWVSVVADRTTVPVGGTIRYTYTVRNTGATSQANVIVDAVAPVNTTFFSLQDPGGLLAPGGFPTLDNIGTLAPGASYTFSVDVTVNGGTPAGTEITSGNYYAKADLYGALYGSPVKTYVEGLGTDLAVSMTAGVSLANACNTAFTMTITNSNPGAIASQAQASLPLPANTQLVSATTTLGLVTGANPVVASLGDMAVGGSATFTVTVRPTTTAAVSGTVTVSGNFTDTVPANDTSTASFANPSGGPQVSITTQPVGATIYPGSTHSMSVVAQDGCGGFTYQWYLNGVAVGGATAANYTTPVLPIGTHNYTVRVTEGSGFYVISNVAVVTVRNPIVTVPALTNGTLDPATPSPASVPLGGTTAFTFNANTGYHVASVSGCSGALYTNTSNAVSSYTYTTGAISGDCTVTATFAPNIYQVTATALANGSLDATTPSPASVAYGSTTSFKFNAAPGYHVASISGCGGPLYTNTSNAVGSYTYTTGAISSDCAITASFAINVYQVTASALANGSLDAGTPSPASVAHGSTTNFTFNANAGYHVASISGCSGATYTNTSNSVGTYTYTTGPITGNCGITATFALNLLYSFSPASGAPGTVVYLSGSVLGSAISVSFNGVPATFTQVSPTQLRAVVPAGATTGPIFVTNAAGTMQSTSNFTVPVPAPRILSFSPNAGSTGTVVFINGLNLGGATAVRFNGTAAVFTVVSATQLKATVPAAATTGPISVTTPSGTATTGIVKFKKL
ncbi:MAG: DUF11 domain-containing protein [Holophagaceae bacterium]|nr:DUF11 domain-containing protein [Holophagaceae bacterium]